MNLSSDMEMVADRVPVNTIVRIYYNKVIGLVIGYREERISLGRGDTASTHNVTQVKIRDLNGREHFSWVGNLDIIEDKEIEDQFAPIMVMNRLSRR